MATRKLTHEDWNPATTSTTYTRATLEPRHERVLIPKTRERTALRPKPLNIPASTQLRYSPPELEAPPPSRKESSESQCDAPRDPEVVDADPSGDWPCRDSPAQRNRRKQSPSTTSQYSTRQSEISLGIIDFYMRDRTPSLHSPELPPTPKLDPAIEKFDFGLPATPTPSTAPTPATKHATAGAERKEEQMLISISPPDRPAPSTNNSYRLFPVIKQVTPPPRQPAITHIAPLPLRDITPPSDSIYRPRKESLNSSVHSRNDSLIAGARQQHRRTPPSSRMISTASSNNSRRTTSTSTTQHSCTSPEILKSRWSDDTITSPVMAPTPDPRTSFGSLLRRDSGTVSAAGQYPACFFEDDDDEEVPLRRRFGTWRKTGSSTASRSSYGSRRAERKGGFWRMMMCGCGGR
ncbi:Hypothetical predicted protein [Lecanosticta acicola]|uniref:Uncharacterized protein n=1 Tax=Lecanosticta acicola TaxID=111012 RepID=A0AAI8W169_9PEZI|nr:Hypothetical predicted protein [Lecanosticta acicola]